VIALALPLCLAAVAAGPAPDPPDVFSRELAHYAWLVGSPLVEYRLAGVQGLAWLKAPEAEPLLLPLAADPEADVRREVAMALGRVGSREALPVLAKLLSDADPGVAQHAALSMQRLTQFQPPGASAATLSAEQVRAMADWWAATTPEAYEGELFAALTDPARRAQALRALRCLAAPESEARFLELIGAAQPPLDGAQEALSIAVLERIGTAASVPWLASVAERQPTAAWPLGRIGGPEAEEALMRGLARFGTWDPQHVICLDRLHSTRCGGFVPALVESFGCLTYRGQPEDLMYDPTPLQQACANLILRAGRGPEVIDLVLREMECRVAPDAELPADLRTQMVRLREELLPGFVRNDGVTTSQPMCAMWHLVQDRPLAPRLVPLLDHPAFLARVYAAMALGNLHAVEALPAITAMIEEGYPFEDPMALASGKHFGDSQTVRWRGFLCLALGRMGGEEARRVLERYATDAAQYRDIRYCAVVGLGFIGSPESLPVLRQVAKDDIIWRIRMEAEGVAQRIELRQKDIAARGPEPEEGGAR